MRKEIIIKHAVALGIMLFIVFLYKCPIYYFFHIPCPGCGVTRAYFSLFALDLESAFEYHPLFFTVAPTILYIAHRNVMKKRLSDKVEKIYFVSLCSLFLIVYVLRVFI